MIPVAIIGGAGYTGGELIRLLINHPFAELTSVVSESQEGKPVSSVHRDLIGDIDLTFNAKLEGQPELIFLCTGHGKARDFMAKAKLDKKTRIIDLSMDFRLADNSHDFVYGLPELNRDKIKASRHIANCGCFATAIQHALLPLAKNHLLTTEIHVYAITGSTGAGQALSDTLHYSWRTNNISVYKPFNHQHVPEILQSIVQLYPEFIAPLHFIPVRGNFTRGIFATVYTSFEGTLEEAMRIYSSYYKDEIFVKIVDQNPDLKQVVNTNKSVLYLEKHGDKLLIISMLDNLLKGASGQAVQNMNIMYGWPEDSGLKLKAVVY
ncbi:MAG: N-acetyl-gamma-glutamyl-phosphate reductase [Saprospiraceae bacterium]